MRSDIQFLRGVAVLIVVGTHAFPQWIPNGHIGVDLFFVISGFLMTKMIASGLERGDFTFRGFYLRRARRLLPASLVTLAVTTALAPFFIPISPSFVWQVVGGLTFTANLVSQAHIDGTQSLQPLSHFWSLSLEEQFYLFFPLLLWFSPMPFRRAGIGIVAAQSFLIMLLMGTTYLLPHRAWELLVGGLVYYQRGSLPLFVKLVALSCVPVAVFFGSIPLAVILTASMLVGKDDWVSLPPIERIGDWSYSLYLIHWPLISFAIAYNHAMPTPALGVCLTALSIGLAYLQYRFVEQPLRGRGRAKVADEQGAGVGRVLI